MSYNLPSNSTYVHLNRKYEDTFQESQDPFKGSQYSKYSVPVSRDEFNKFQRVSNLDFTHYSPIGGPLDRGRDTYQSRREEIVVAGVGDNINMDNIMSFIEADAKRNGHENFHIKIDPHIRDRGNETLIERHSSPVTHYRQQQPQMHQPSETSYMIKGNPSPNSTLIDTNRSYNYAGNRPVESQGRGGDVYRYNLPKLEPGTREVIRQTVGQPGESFKKYERGEVTKYELPQRRYEESRVTVADDVGRRYNEPVKRYDDVIRRYADETTVMSRQIEERAYSPTIKNYPAPSANLSQSRAIPPTSIPAAEYYSSNTNTGYPGRIGASPSMPVLNHAGYPAAPQTQTGVTYTNIIQNTPPQSIGNSNVNNSREVRTLTRTDQQRSQPYIKAPDPVPTYNLPPSNDQRGVNFISKSSIKPSSPYPSNQSHQIAPTQQPPPRYGTQGEELQYIYKPPESVVNDHPPPPMSAMKVNSIKPHPSAAKETKLPLQEKKFNPPPPLPPSEPLEARQIQFKRPDPHGGYAGEQQSYPLQNFYNRDPSPSRPVANTSINQGPDTSGLTPERKKKIFSTEFVSRNTRSVSPIRGGGNIPPPTQNQDLNSECRIF